MMCSRVDLPPPLGPTIPIRECCGISKSMPRRTTSSPNLLPMPLRWMPTPPPAAASGGLLPLPDASAGNNTDTSGCRDLISYTSDFKDRNSGGLPGQGAGGGAVGTGAPGQPPMAVGEIWPLVERVGHVPERPLQPRAGGEDLGQAAPGLRRWTRPCVRHRDAIAPMT